MDQKIEIINNWNLSKFFKELETGRIRIPRFQRGYIWERAKIVQLLNSIYLQYPIGSIFLWDAPGLFKGYIRQSDIICGADADHASYMFILDGQQRITSLYATLKGRNIDGADCRSIYLNLDRKEFAAASSKKTNTLVPAWKLLDPVAYGDTLADFAILDREKNSSYARIWRECHEIFTNYPLSIVVTSNSDLDDVVEIFERINQGGKRLSAFDLVQASTWSPDFDLSESITAFNSKNCLKKLDDIEPRFFTMAMTINISENFNNTLQLQVSAEQYKKNWNRTVRGMQHAIDFIKSMGITDDLKPYYGLLPVLQFYFFKSGKSEIDEAHRAALEKWFWDAKLSNNYIGNVGPQIRKDISWLLKVLA
jgi:hypothetical protein